MKKIWIFTLLLLFISRTQAFSALQTKDEMPEFLNVSDWAGDPQSKETLKEKVVVTVFFNFTDPVSIQLAKALADWKKKLAPLGFEVVGIVTPDLAFEKDALEFYKSAERLKLPYSVVLDADSWLWKAYNTPSRPAHYFIDGEGKIRNTPPLEASFPEQQKALEELFREADPDFEPEPPASAILKLPKAETINFGFKSQPPLGNPIRTRLDAARKFSMPSEIRQGLFYLNGQWKFAEDHLETAEGGTAFKIKWDGRPVYLVAGAKRDTPATSEVLIDGHPMTDKNLKGSELVKQAGKSFLFVQEFKIYEIIRRLPSGEHTLEIRFPSKGVELYRMNFLSEEISR